uniref:Putative zinc finger CCCH domain-containing protein 25 isoform X2 n=1 Tax=Davidia involucrata TaxID=16924 RepID=A0A5B6YX91_DAVIN
MNPLTLVKRIQKINSKEAALGISEEASWHVKYKESAYVFVGGIPFDLTEGDLLAVFAQYGEIVDVNLVRDKGTGKSKGFAFIAYEDQRSTNLAVDNLNGAQILGRIIRVDHVTKYKKKEEEDEETERQKREARGVCRAFQKGECNRGAGCKFSHDEQRAANTGWGPEDNRSSRWGHDKFEGSTKYEKRSGQSNHVPESAAQEGLRSSDKDARSSRAKGYEGGIEGHYKRSELNSRDQDSRGLERQLERKEKEMNQEWDRRATDRRSTRNDVEPNSGEDHDRREKRSRRHESESSHREDRDNRGGEKRSTHDRDSSSHHHRGRDDDHRRRSHR